MCNAHFKTERRSIAPREMAAQLCVVVVMVVGGGGGGGRAEGGPENWTRPGAPGPPPPHPPAAARCPERRVCRAYPLCISVEHPVVRPSSPVAAPRRVSCPRAHSALGNSACACECIATSQAAHIGVPGRGRGTPRPSGTGRCCPYPPGREGGGHLWCAVDWEVWRESGAPSVSKLDSDDTLEGRDISTEPLVDPRWLSTGLAGTVGSGACVRTPPASPWQPLAASADAAAVKDCVQRDCTRRSHAAATGSTKHAVSAGHPASIPIFRIATGFMDEQWGRCFRPAAITAQQCDCDETMQTSRGVADQRVARKGGVAADGVPPAAPPGPGGGRGGGGAHPHLHHVGAARLQVHAVAAGAGGGAGAVPRGC